MGKQKLKGKDLRKIGFRSDKAKSLAINIMATHFKHLHRAKKLELLEKLIENPEDYAEDKYLKPLAEEFMEKVVKEAFTSYKLSDESKPYKVYGKQFICRNTINQMDQAMRLPIAEKGALMPDAHVGYGLPIGGVLATKNEVIPYAVGLDIGCRMSVTLFDVESDRIDRDRYQLKMALQEETQFGISKVAGNTEHSVLDRPEFRATEVLRKLHGKAAMQLGSSGAGNHFVEFGEMEILEENNLNIPAGKYMALVSHSGSRGLGAAVAQYYTRIAQEVCKLPKGSQHLAWLDLDSEAGMEYWIAMNLAGDYAKACHDVIHSKIAKRLNLKKLITVENHHNFAWKEKQENGETLIVHRKGSTPAKEGELGFIPGSMSHPGYLVSGKGKQDALSSASHGAGRKLSRSKAKSSLTGSDMKKELKQKRVTLIGGAVDESPFAYKNIEEVIGAQKELIKVEGKFNPRIVRMAK